MTEKELKNLVVRVKNNKYLTRIETDYIADALKKQIPIDPYIEGDGYADDYLVYDTWICPNCETHYEIDYDDYDYCPCCGQHIDKTKLN